jgi:asparagine synthase (glutamine-hydrolysing)
MCGIVALWGREDRQLVETLIERQRHRGPDGNGLLATDAATLGHCRLAIIDPAHGQQPIESGPANDGGTAIVANGMIYNDAALRARYRDASWMTGSDSESILHAVARSGPAAIAGLDGMFAFAMIEDGRLIAARDPIGIKPLYMGRRGTDRLFASEIKALAGIVDEIEEFPAGHYWVSDATGGGAYTSYYGIPAAAPGRWNVADATMALRETLEAAVVKRLRSDVPFGCLLSGGLDSSIIAALARKHVPDLKTFAVGLPGSSDLAAARTVADHLGTDHHALVLEPAEIEAALPDILYHLESFDRDLVRSAVPCWFVARFAAAHVKVVLTGEGADELFAGYTYYRDIASPDALHDELRHSISSMHNINLQRVDRMAMAHGLEARVPFLDTTMIALGLDLPVEWAIAGATVHGRGSRRIEKWILRKAFEDLLPPEIVWRDKVQFDQGSGLETHLRALFEDGTTDTAPPDATDPRRSAEERHYRRLLADRFDDPATVLGLVAHWNTRDHAGAPPN